jgi:hypothetical protein
MNERDPKTLSTPSCDQTIGEGIDPTKGASVGEKNPRKVARKGLRVTTGLKAGNRLSVGKDG